MSKIKLLVMDVDGTLTDGKIYMSASGELFKVFDIKDGCGIHDLLPKVGIVPVVITARESAMVSNRCRELGIDYCFQGCRDKVAKIVELAVRFGLLADENGVYQEIAYAGDDIIDIPCMYKCGIVGCPSDAAAEVTKIATFVSSKKGGDGAVRDFIDWMVSDENNY